MIIIDQMNYKMNEWIIFLKIIMNNNNNSNNNN